MTEQAPNGLKYLVEEQNRLAEEAFAWRMRQIRNWLKNRDHERMKQIFLTRDQVRAERRIQRFL